MPTAREGESTRGGPPLSLGGLGGFLRENFEFLALLCAFFNGVICVWDQISVTIFCQKRYYLAREKTEC